MPNKFVGHGPYHYAEGGHVRKELKFMADKGAPESMIKAEKKEHGLPFGKAKKFAAGGMAPQMPQQGGQRPPPEWLAAKAKQEQMLASPQGQAMMAQRAQMAQRPPQGPPPGAQVPPQGGQMQMPPQGPPPGSAMPAPQGMPLQRPPMPQGMRPQMPQRPAPPAPTAMAKGGSIDGCATRGKTRARRG